MNNLKNYIKYYKNISFNQSKFNNIDNIILSSLSYLNFSSILKNKPKKLSKVYEQYNKLMGSIIKNEPIIVREAFGVLESIMDGVRYKDIYVSDFVNIVDDEKQFGALSFRLPNKILYIAYQGTDDSLIGWQEDFYIPAMFPIPSQKLAIDYINKVVKISDSTIYVGGHSKGGNLAMTAASFANFFIRFRIKRVFNNDGPGFREKEYNHPKVQKMFKKLTTIIPKDSIIGLCLNKPNKYIVVDTNLIGILQHDLHSWLCYGEFFIEGELSESSKKLKKNIDKWVNKYDEEKIKKLVDEIFFILKEAGYTKFSEVRKLSLVKLAKLINLSIRMDDNSKKLAIHFMKIVLFGTYE